MPGNPLTDPRWATDLADTVERVVGQVRDRATKPVVHVARGVVYGLLAGLIGLAAAVLGVIVATRALQSLLELAVEWPRAVYLSYLIIGGILCIAGALFLKRRQSDDA